jgi:hypothetical protein
MFRKIFQPREILVSLCKRDVVYKIPLWENIIPESVVVRIDKGYLEIKFGIENPPAEKSPAETLGGGSLEKQK